MIWGRSSAGRPASLRPARPHARPAGTGRAGDTAAVTPRACLAWGPPSAPGALPARRPACALLIHEAMG